MKTGMLWYDNSDKPLVDKLEQIKAKWQSKYAQKYGDMNLILTHDNQPDTIEGIEVRQDKTLMKGYYFAGNKDN